MKKGLIIIVLAGLLVVPAFAQHPPQDKNWKVVFQDDFSSLNTSSRWDVMDNFDEYGLYAVYRKKNVYIDSGKLVLETKEEDTCYHCPKQHVGPYGCKREYLYKESGIEWCYQYSASCVKSKEMYKYGYFEIYTKMPEGNGFYPAFWLHSNGINLETNNCFYNEIDIAEIDDCKEKPFSMSPLCDVSCPNPTNKGHGRTHIAFDYYSAYHWYGLEWDRDKITWYIDRQAVKQRANNMDGVGIQNAMVIIINLALHAPDNDCPITSSSVFPNYMYLDQANVYQLKCDKNTVVNEISDFNTYCYAVKKSISLGGATTIPARSNISLRATDFIELKPGFEVPLGAELYLDINPCSGPNYICPPSPY